MAKLFDGYVSRNYLFWSSVESLSWASLTDIILGLVLLGGGVVLGGPGFERLDSLVIGGVLGILGGYNLSRLASGQLEHPDGLRALAVVGLWLIGYPLTVDPSPLNLLSRVSLGVGILVVGVNSLEYARRFKARPERRQRARRQSVPSTTLAESVLRSITRHTSRLPAPELTLPFILAVPVGVGAGIGAAVFRFLMFAIHEFLFETVLPQLPSRLWIAAIPVFGAGVAGLVIYEFAPEAAGHGVPENMEAIARTGGRIRHRLAPLKVLVSALTLGAGGSGGREGPIARIGAGIGSSLSQLVGLSDRNTRLMLTAGIAAGIGATFGAPIGGIFFGLEIVMARRVTLYNVAVLAVTTLIAVATGRFIAPHFAWFTFMPFAFPTLSLSARDVMLVAPYGVALGLVSWAWVRILDRTERVFNAISLPNHVKPMVGAIPVGVLGIWYANYGVMGVGYDGLRFAVSDVSMGALFLLGLAAAKLVATQFTIGSGGSGGVFAPTLYIGGLFAVGLHQLLGVVPVSPALVGVVGMAGAFSGAAFAPLTATFLIAEVFDAYQLAAVLFIPSVLSFLVAQRMLTASIYTSRLHRKGILDGYREIAAEIGPISRPEPLPEDVDSVLPDAIAGQTSD